ncbi:hypothetical protein GOODEAATRI_012227 [Goodea atripinnis]|uniref:Uncharacterized protein n=1 Tax=Goodea atripinnis TaxID=208336 RepID=A0ABV0MH53_9TELE
MFYMLKMFLSHEGPSDEQIGSILLSHFLLSGHVDTELSNMIISCSEESRSLEIKVQSSNRDGLCYCFPSSADSSICDLECKIYITQLLLLYLLYIYMLLLRSKFKMFSYVFQLTEKSTGRNLCHQKLNLNGSD